MTVIKIVRCYYCKWGRQLRKEKKRFEAFLDHMEKSHPEKLVEWMAKIKENLSKKERRKR